jgi:hypothetical protein
MKWIPIGVSVLGALAAAFWLGRLSRVEAESGEPLLAPESLAAALADGDWTERTYRFSALIRQLNPENLDPALEVIEASPAELTNDEMRLLMHSWTRFDPEGAFEFALFAPKAQRRWLAGAVIHAWAQRDPVAAHGALLGIQNTDLERVLEQRFVMGQIKGEGLAEAHAYVAGLPPSARRELLVGEIAKYLAAESAAAVIEWAEGADPDDARLKNTVFKKAAGALAEYDLQQAARWVASQYGRPHSEGGARLVALNWAESDPGAAFGWLASLPGGEEQRGAVAFVFAYWLSSHPGKAEAWLEDAEPSEALDPALRAMAQSTANDDPVTAIEWAQRIQDPGTRERTLVRIGQRWYRVDPEATRRWLAVSGLPRAGQKKILEAGR